MADDSKFTQVERPLTQLVFEFPEDLFQTESFRPFNLPKSNSKSKPLYDTPIESPVKAVPSINFSWKDQQNFPRQLIGVLEEVKETSGIEVMEQESSMMVEELTDV